MKKPFELTILATTLFVLMYTLFFLYRLVYPQPVYQNTPYAFYECLNQQNSYVRFRLPDTWEKRRVAISNFSCFPLPKPTMLTRNQNSRIIGYIEGN